MPSLTVGRCDAPGCGAAIVFVTVSNRAGRPPGPMPLDASPDPEGNVAVHQDDKQVWRGRVLGKDQEPAPHETRYYPHAATCANPGGHRKRQRDDWRRAQSAHSAAQRNRRGGARPAVRPAGYQVRPPALPGFGDLR